MTKVHYTPISALRDHFMQINNAEAAEICNEMMTVLDASPSLFVLSKEETDELAKYFLTCGYISHEFHGPVHAIIDRLLEFTRRSK